MRFWVGMVCGHHEVCQEENWMEAYATLKEASFGPGDSDFKWNATLRAHFECSKAHFVIHWMTDGYLQDGSINVREITDTPSPTQKDLKLVLALLRICGYSCRMREWHIHIKDIHII